MHEQNCPYSIHHICDGINMQWHIALHMHENIALNRCECMVNKSTLCLVFDGGLGALGRRLAKSHD